MEGVIRRSPRAAARRAYDLVIVGGGVYGVALSLEAARRGLQPILVERGDFGGETSRNSLRIIHGGLRYLQRMDLSRFFESVAERTWFLRNFPDQVRPLPCLMPLYGRGPRHPLVLRAALVANDLLSFRRNVGVALERRLPRGRVLDPHDTVALFPRCRRDGLLGGALWHDAVMVDSERLLIEMLRWACASGATALNYMEARDLIVKDGNTVGLRAADVESGETFELRAPFVVNCAGPWCRELAKRFHEDIPDLFHGSLAFNAVLDRKPPADVALAVDPARPDARTYFLHPWKGRIFAGTFHAPCDPDSPDAAPTETHVAEFLADLNSALPGLKVRPDDVRHLRWGRLPAAAEGSDELAHREVVHDHSAGGGPAGLWSVSGVKFTTARRVAEKTLGAMLGTKPPPLGNTPRPERRQLPAPREMEDLIASDRPAALDIVRGIVRDEAVVRLDDLILRRTDWAADRSDEDLLVSHLRGLLQESGFGAIA